LKVPMHVYRQTKQPNAHCRQCGAAFYALPGETNRGAGKYCSPACSRPHALEAVKRKRRADAAARISAPFLFEGEMVCAVATKRGKAGLVNAEDAPLVNHICWHPDKDGHLIGASFENGVESRRTVALHQLILKAPEGMEVDHLNRNPLDNRRKNLRAVPHKHNSQNVSPLSRSNTGHRGVHQLANGRYIASCRRDGKPYHVGVFDTLQGAVAAVKRARAFYMPGSPEALESDGSLAWEGPQRPDGLTLIEALADREYGGSL
jgi:hypothetical protein